jgi:hypothetical protein
MLHQIIKEFSHIAVLYYIYTGRMFLQKLDHPFSAIEMEA